MPDEHDDSTDSPVIQELRAKLRQYEKRDADNQAVTARMAELERELVFTKAGIPEDGPAKWFRQSFTAPDGEALTVEMVRAAALADGIISGPKPEGSPEEQRAIANISEVAGGTPPPPQSIINEIGQAESEEALLKILGREGLLAEY